MVAESVAESVLAGREDRGVATFSRKTSGFSFTRTIVAPMPSASLSWGTPILTIYPVQISPLRSRVNVSCSEARLQISELLSCIDAVHSYRRS